jgi:hypothetical protein
MFDARGSPEVPIRDVFCMPQIVRGGAGCADLKQEIEAKLTAKGVKGYTLEIVAADQVQDQKVVGSCEGGKKKITYTREQAQATKK